MPKDLLTVALMLAVPITAAAQDRAGNDTAGDWRVTHYESHGIWTSICDERHEPAGISDRCYIRWVDVFSARPKFAGQFLFVTPEDSGMKVEFGIEAGTLFSFNGFYLQRGQEIVWRTRSPGCLTGLGCTFGGVAADTLLKEMRTGGEFRFLFRDRHGQSQDLTWPLLGFEAAFDDFTQQSTARGLISDR